jgi:hypothetical protein
MLFTELPEAGNVDDVQALLPIVATSDKHAAA